VDRSAGEDDGGEAEGERREGGDERAERAEEDDEDEREAGQLAARELALRNLCEVRPDRRLADYPRLRLGRRLDERVADARRDVDRVAARPDVRHREERGAAAVEEACSVRAERSVARGGGAGGGEARPDGGGRAAGDEDRERGTAEARERVELVGDAHGRASRHVPAAAREPVGL